MLGESCNDAVGGVFSEIEEAVSVMDLLFVDEILESLIEKLGGEIEVVEFVDGVGLVV